MGTEMEQTASVDAEAVARVARETVDDLGLDPYLNCGPISEKIRDALETELGLEAASVVNGYVIDGAAYDEHAYVKIPAGRIGDKAGAVIVDGSVRQFDRDHVDEGRNWVCLEEKVDGDLPRVVVQGRRDSLHEFYAERCPF